MEEVVSTSQEPAISAVDPSPVSAATHGEAHTTIAVTSDKHNAEGHVNSGPRTPQGLSRDHVGMSSKEELDNIAEIVNAAEASAFAARQLDYGFSPQPPPNSHGNGGDAQGFRRHYSPRVDSTTDEDSYASKLASIKSSVLKVGLPKVVLPQKAVDELVSNHKQSSKKPLYLRLIQAAERENKIQEKIREEKYLEWKEFKKKAQPTKQDVRSHMENHNRLAKQRNDAAAAAAIENAAIAKIEYRKLRGMKNNIKHQPSAAAMLPSIPIASYNNNNMNAHASDADNDNDSISQQSYDYLSAPHHPPQQSQHRNAGHRKITLESEIKRQQQREADEAMRKRIQRRQAFGRKVRDRALNKADLSPERRAEIASDFEDGESVVSISENMLSPRVSPRISPRLAPDHNPFESPKKVSFHDDEVGQLDDDDLQDLAAFAEFKKRTPKKPKMKKKKQHYFSPIDEYDSNNSDNTPAGDNFKPKIVKPKAHQAPMDDDIHVVDLEHSLFPQHGPEWVYNILRYDPEEDKLAEIYEQGFTIMMIENGLIDDR